MKTCKNYSLFLVMGFVFLISVPSQAQWVTLVRKVKSMATSHTDVATVIIDAKTFRVYQTVIDSLSASPKFGITNRNNAKRLVEFTSGENKISMQVDSLAAGLSQIMVAANHSNDSQKQQTDVAVEAILRVCKMVGVKCTVDK